MKKSMSVILASVMLLTGIGAEAAQITIDAESVSKARDGWIPIEEPEIEIVENEESAEKPKRQVKKSTRAASALPGYYSSVEQGFVTEPKNQGGLGVCWAFATIGAMETSMIKKGLAQALETDFSEYHLAYFTNKRNTITGDGEDKKSTSDGYFVSGNQLYAGMRLVGRQGAELEENYTYSTNVSQMPNIDESKRYSSYAHLTDYFEIEKSEMKGAIMEYGGVVVSYYDNDDCYASGGKAYYNNKESGGGHAVFIVGWDDNYARSNFNANLRPQNDGAWIVKNSWGKNAGDGGYFYMSYETTPLKNITVFNADSSDKYPIVNQYDGAGHNLLVGCSRAANVFTAEKNQIVKAVGFYVDRTSSADASYSVKVYKLDAAAENPEDGVLVSQASGTKEHDGYYTQPLTESVSLNSGDRFSVVLELEDSYHSFEGGSSNYSSNEGESYYYDGTAWREPGKTRNNVCIKAYSAEENVTVKFSSNGGSNVADAVVSKGSALSTLQRPQRGGKYFAGWYSDSGCTKLFSPGDTVLGNMTLWAKWSDTPQKVQSVTITTAKQGLVTGETLKPVIEVSPYYAENREVALSASNSCVEILSDGSVLGKTAGEVTVTAASKDGGATGTLSLTVYDAMGKAEISLEKLVYKTSETPAFVVNVPNAEKFVIHFVDWGSTNEMDKEYMGYSIRIGGLPEETVTEVYVEAFDILGNRTVSETKSFMISNNKTQVVKYSEDSGYIYSIWNGDTAGTSIAAYYGEGDELLAVKTAGNLSESLAVFPKLTDSESVKFMWWNSKNGMEPVTEAIEIDCNNGTGLTFFAQ